MWFTLCKIVHVIGNVMWLGGGALAAFAFVQLSREDAKVKLAGAQALRKVTLYLVTPGMLLSLAGGLSMLIGFWSELYAKHPWAHSKLTVGIIAAAFSGVLTGRLRRAASGAEVPPGAVRNAGIVLVLSAIANVMLVYLRPGG